MNNTSAPRRIWRAFGPLPVAAPSANVMAVRKPASTNAWALVVDGDTRKTPPTTPQGRWQPCGDSEPNPMQSHRPSA